MLSVGYVAPPAATIAGATGEFVPTASGGDVLSLLCKVCQLKTFVIHYIVVTLRESGGPGCSGAALAALFLPTIYRSKRI